MNEDQRSASVEEAEVTAAPPVKPLWKRVLYFDLGFPGQVIEGGLKGLHVLILVILGVEAFNLPWSSQTVVKPMAGLVLDAGSHWRWDGKALKAGARYTSEPAVATLPFSAVRELICCVSRPSCSTPIPMPS